MKEGFLSNLYLKHQPMDGLTVSTPLLRKEGVKITYFSLGKGTDISKETYPDKTLYFPLGGELSLDRKDKSLLLRPYDAYLNPEGVLRGTKTKEGTGYIEIQIGKETETMNCARKAGEVFSLKDLVDYQEDSIVNKDLLSNEKRKFVVMAFDQGQALSAHRAPGEAVLFILEGKGIISYEGKDYEVKEGDEFRFAKNGLHAVKALTKFKMALLLALD